MADHSLNLAIVADTKEFETGMQRVVNTVRNAGGQMGDAAADATGRTVSSFKSLQQAYRTTVADAERVALEFGTQSEAFKDASIKAAAYKQELDNVHAALYKQQMAVSGGTSMMQTATKANNMMAFSIAQVTREMPAFTYSMQTGFLAISNNIPMVVDAIKRLKDENVKLAATGQPVQSAFKQVLGAIFSWQTALSIGVTLLTVFGAKVIDSIWGTKELGNAQEETSKKTKGLTDAIRDQTTALYDRNKELRLQLQAAQSGKSLDEVTLQNNEKRISEIRKETDEIDLNNSVRLSNLMLGKQVAIKDEKHIKDLRDEMAALDAQNVVLRQNVNLQKELDKTKNKPSEKVKEFKTKEGKAILSGPEIAAKIGGFDISTQVEDLSSLIDVTKEYSLTMDLAAAKHEDFLKSLQDNAKLMEAANQVMSASFMQLGASIGDAFATGDLGGSMLGFLASFMATVGSAAIAVGLAYQAMGFSIGQGIAAVGAGVALIAGSRIVASKGNGGGGSGAFSTSFSSTSGSGGPQFSSSANYIQVGGLVRGNNLVIAIDNQGRTNKRIR